MDRLPSVEGKWIFNETRVCSGLGESSGSRIPVSASPARTGKIPEGTENAACLNILEKADGDDRSRGVLLRL